MNILDTSELKFEEKEHKYFLKDKELTPVSRVIHHFVPPFDPTGEILIKCATKENISPEELQKRWSKEKDDACKKGTDFHSEMEDFIKDGKIDGKNKDIVEQFAKFKFKGQLLSECRIYNENLKIAGTVDIIEFDKKTHSCKIFDFKTNKKLKKYGFKGEKMLPPLGHLDNANYFHYCIQLNLYAYLLELAGYWAAEGGLKLYYINPKTREIEIHPIPDIRSDIENMLKYWKNPKEAQKIKKSAWDFWQN